MREEWKGKTKRKEKGGRRGIYRGSTTSAILQERAAAVVAARLE